MKDNLLRLTLLLLTTLLCAADAKAQLAYTLTDLGSLGGGNSFAYSINNQGQIVGDSINAAGQDQPFLYSNGTMHDIGTPNSFLSGSAVSINAQGQAVGTATNTVSHPMMSFGFLYSNGKAQMLNGLSNPQAINDAGQIVGYTNGFQAFLYSNGQTTSLGTLGGATSAALALNNEGQITGLSATADASHAFLYQNGVMQDIGKDINLFGTEGDGINDNGVVAGTGYLPDGSGIPRGFIWQNGQAQILGTLGGKESDAFSINNAGVVVGTSTLPNNTLSPFAYANGQMLDLFAGTGWSYGIAEHINDSGQIVGYGVHNGFQRAFLATPNQTPAPSSLLVAGLGAGLLALRCRRKSSMAGGRRGNHPLR